jgi:hypothetical protein
VGGELAKHLTARIGDLYVGEVFQQTLELIDVSKGRLNGAHGCDGATTHVGHQVREGLRETVVECRRSERLPSELDVVGENRRLCAARNASTRCGPRSRTLASQRPSAA